VRKPSILTGGLIGLLIAAPVIVVFALGNALLGLPFFPFDLFDWLVPVLPSAAINTGKEIMIAVITGLGLGRLDTVAKLAEQAIGVGIALLLSVIIGALYFFIMNRVRRAASAPSNLPGIVLGIVIGVPLLLISLAVNFDASAAPMSAAIWIVGLSLVWGMLINVVYMRLAQSASVTADANAALASAEAIDRRQFIVRVGGAAAAITVVGAGVSALLNSGDSDSSASSGTSVAALPDGLANSADGFEPAPGTRREITPVEDHYRIDIRTTPVVIEPEGYMLPFTTRLSGSEETLKTLTLDEIRAFPATDVYITMSCISNPVGGELISTTRWTGVSMQTILAEVGIPDGATHLKITGGDGFDETVALDLIASDERIMLAYDWDGQPLTNKYGFPLRIHVPNLFGMKQPKWIMGMEFIGADEDGYWVRRGWDKDAITRATSVIDTVYIDNITENAGTTIVPIGGITWAGARGVARVEISVDDGDWTEVTLRAPISDRTWQLWRYDWEFSEGSHTFVVRCVESDGTPQIEARAGTLPSGATGLFSVRESISL